MNNDRLQRLVLSTIFTLMVGSSQPAGKYILAGMGGIGWAEPAQPAPETPLIRSAEPVKEEKPAVDNQPYDLLSEIKTFKKRLGWEDPSPGKPGIASALCRIWDSCPNGRSLTEKLFIVDIEEEPQYQGRMLNLSWTDNPDHPDVILGYINGNEGEFFLIDSYGSLDKAAYKQKGQRLQLKSKEIMRPHFEKEAQAWHEWFLKKFGDKQR